MFSNDNKYKVNNLFTILTVLCRLHPLSFCKPAKQDTNIILFMDL